VNLTMNNTIKEILVRIAKADISIDYFINIIGSLCEKGHKDSETVQRLLSELDNTIEEYNDAVRELNTLTV